jgi:hypothetical protein
MIDRRRGVPTRAWRPLLGAVTFGVFAVVGAGTDPLLAICAAACAVGCALLAGWVWLAARRDAAADDREDDGPGDPLPRPPTDGAPPPGWTRRPPTCRRRSRRRIVSRVC